MTLVEGQVLGPLTRTLTRADLIAYAAASGDDNPIHLSDEAARAAGLDGVLAHGMLTFATALRAVTDLVGAPRVRATSVRFRAPVPVPAEGGVTLTVTGTVQSVTDESATIGLEATVPGPDGEPVKVLGATRAEVAL